MSDSDLEETSILARPVRRIIVGNTPESYQNRPGAIDDPHATDGTSMALNIQQEGAEQAREALSDDGR